MPPPPLPVATALPSLRVALQAPGAAVLQAPPGAGKTTVVPLELLREPWLEGRKIVMLEPRRLAARAAARRMASTLGEPVGRTIGYRVRFDTRVSDATRIEVVTEGVLTRLRQDDPSLEGIGLVIFDEFHERSIHADLGLALTLETRSVLRPDLRLLVMSATIAGNPVARLLGNAPVVTCEGRLFPVETRYRPRRPDQRHDGFVAGVIREALVGDEGDVLVFLPGAGEINRVAAMLEDGGLPPGVRLYRLHGMLPAEDQDAAIAPSPAGMRKVVLATSIAETSLTIDGVRVVVDGGLMRVPRFSPRTGMGRLETVRVTRASADQRRGRAGRTAPGLCYRCWAPHDDLGLMPFGTPEILSSDLAPLALDLAAAGVTDPLDLAWLDPPPAAAFTQARELLTMLDALDAEGRITPHGRRMASLPLHPRLAHLAIEARRLGMAALAADLAALLSDRDIARRADGQTGGRAAIPDADVRLRLEALTTGRAPGGLEIDAGALRRVRGDAAEWRRRLGATARDRSDLGAAGRLLAVAYPDRIAQRRAGEAGRFLLRNGRGASLPPGQPLGREDWLVAAELDDAGSESRIILAAPLDSEDVAALAEGATETTEEVRWDQASGRVTARKLTRLGALVMQERAVSDPDASLVRTALLDAVRREGLGILPWNDSATRLRQRLAFLRRLDPAWPDVADAALLEQLEDWLAPRIGDARKGLSEVNLGEALVGLLDWERRRRLEELAPERWEVPTGSMIAIDYADPGAPVLAVRLQEVFGMTETPRIGGGRVPLVMHLLSPAYRPVQVTRDLANFWRSGYFDVRKDLRGRYPKHHWPEDPLTAEPVRGAKRRRPR
ncbi:MAG TPA: ATP-dependent helicase HrpB [Gemmatimonadales bacterium]